jgi:1-acyl-sn-glycerol-3-phosphate acyltransferase
MGRLNEASYTAARALGRCVYAMGIRGQVLRPAIPARAGGYVLAVTHLSHLEPFVVSVLVRRKVDWMARVEFFRYRPFGAMLRAVDVFPVKRAGVPVAAIRTAIARARAGRVVGIFPEGGTATGRASACRGGPIKQGACLVALRAGVPVVPCVVLGTHALNAIEAWFPFHQTRLWIGFGSAIEPPPQLNRSGRRAARMEMSQQLGDAFCSLYNEMRQRYGIPDGSIP